MMRGSAPRLPTDVLLIELDPPLEKSYQALSLILTQWPYWAMNCHWPSMCSQFRIHISTLGLAPTAANVVPPKVTAVAMPLFLTLPTIAETCDPGAYDQPSPTFQASRSWPLMLLRSFLLPKSARARIGPPL